VPTKLVGGAQPNVLLNLPPGAVFVHRNIGNQAGLRDLNCMSVVEYAVSNLKARMLCKLPSFARPGKCRRKPCVTRGSSSTALVSAGRPVAWFQGVLHAAATPVGYSDRLNTISGARNQTLRVFSRHAWQHHAE